MYIICVCSRRRFTIINDERYLPDQATHNLCNEHTYIYIMFGVRQHYCPIIIHINRCCICIRVRQERPLIDCNDNQHSTTTTNNFVFQTLFFCRFACVHRNRVGLPDFGIWLTDWRRQWWWWSEDVQNGTCRYIIYRCMIDVHGLWGTDTIHDPAMMRHKCTANLACTMHHAKLHTICIAHTHTHNEQNSRKWMKKLKKKKNNIKLQSTAASADEKLNKTQIKWWSSACDVSIKKKKKLAKHLWAHSSEIDTEADWRFF